MRLGDDSMPEWNLSVNRVSVGGLLINHPMRVIDEGHSPGLKQENQTAQFQ